MPENDELQFLNSYTAEEVLKSVILYLKPLLSSVSGSADMLADDKYQEYFQEDVQRIQRCVKLMRQATHNAEIYMQKKKLQ